MLPEVGQDMEPFSKIFLLERLQEMGVSIKTSMMVNRIDEYGVQAVDNMSNKQSFQAENVIIAVGSASCTDLKDKLTKQRKEIYMIGDCKTPNKLLEAIHDATNIIHLL